MATPCASTVDPQHSVASRSGSLLLVLAAALVAGGLTALFAGLTVSGWVRGGDHGPAAAADLLVTALAAGGAVLSAWLGLGIVATALAGLPGTVGSACAALRDRITPALVRRAVAVVLGGAVVTAGVPGIGVADDDPGPPRPTPTSAQLPAAPDPAFAPTAPRVAGPPDPAFRATRSTIAPTPLPSSVRRPTSETSPAPVAGDHPFLPPTPPPAIRVPSLGPLGGQSRLARIVGETVVVRRGDTLWSIAARHLEAGATAAEIVHEWPRWYAANRAVIGADPHHIEPGQQLVPPTTRGR